jgi:hypothetical protein
METNKQKSMIVGTLFVALFLMTMQLGPVQASDGFFGDLGDAIDRTGANYNQGEADGKHAGVNGYSNDCPSNDASYCVGWNIGYNHGFKSAQTVNANRDD